MTALLLSALWLAFASPERDTECLSRVEPVAVVIRDVVHFSPGEATLADGASAEVLRQVGLLLSRDQQIDHTVINGHAAANEEGDLYLLSVTRARLVWEALVAAGVPPQRISYRGLGATPSTYGEGAHASFDIVVVFDLDRPEQGSMMEPQAVERVLQEHATPLVSPPTDAPTPPQSP